MFENKSLFEKNVQLMFQAFRSPTALASMAGFLFVYTLVVAYLFRPNQHGRRRRWLPMDYVWVPLGGLTGLCLVAVWWRMHAPM